MNHQIRRVGLVLAAMFLALLINLTYFTVGRQPGLLADPQNRRARDAEFATQRGAILAGSTEIANSVASDGAFKFQRQYPQGEMYANVTGFYSYIYGSSGLESSFNQYLAGSDATQWVDRLVDRLTGSSPTGAFVQTTIDPKLQQAARTAMGSMKGAAVAIDPKTGAVLALVSTPSYDPNQLASHDLTAVQAAWTALNADPDRPMSDRASREIYPPGSTFKLVTAAAALANGYTADTQVDTPAQLQLPNSTSVLTNETRCGDGTVSLDVALQKSCNTAFASLGATLGADKIAAQAAAFGFGTRQLTDLGGAASRFPTNLDAAQTMLSSIGQFDVAASPLQMAMVAAGVANDGVVMSPYVVSEVRSNDLQVLYRHASASNRAMDVANARVLQQLMVNVVEKGTGTPARISGVTVGGKTGTAQTDLARKPYAWFVSFAKDPDIAVAVFVEDADVDRTDVAGGRLAGPVAKAVIQASRS